MTFTLVRFMAVGGLGLVVNSIVLFVLYQLLGLPLILASALSVEVAIANNFYWNERWTFRVTSGHSFRRFLKFNLVSVIGLTVASATAWLLVQQANLNYLLANLGGVALATVCNVVANTTWTWRTS